MERKTKSREWSESMMERKSTYLLGSGTWLQTARRYWKLFLIAWILAMPMNTTSQFG